MFPFPTDDELIFQFLLHRRVVIIFCPEFIPVLPVQDEHRRRRRRPLDSGRPKNVSVSAANLRDDKLSEREQPGLRQHQVKVELGEGLGRFGLLILTIG